MTQNRSTAVMQRRVEAHDSLDDFPTPPWATRALCEYVIHAFDREEKEVWEPCCNRGYMARPLGEYFGKVHATDIHDYGYEGHAETVDFLFAERETDWVITNPPFRLAERVIEHALKQARIGVAVIVRSAFLEGKGRYENLFSVNPPSTVAQFVERVPMVKGRYDPVATTATSYAWLVWDKREQPTQPRMFWIPPCRKQLERDGDAGPRFTGAAE